MNYLWPNETLRDTEIIFQLDFSLLDNWKDNPWFFLIKTVASEQNAVP